MAVAFGQVVKASQSVGQTTLTRTITPTAGSLLVVGNAVNEPGAGDETITSVVTSVANLNGTTAFTLDVAAPTIGAEDNGATLYSLPNAAGSAQTITVTYHKAGGVNKSSVFVLELLGADISATPKDGTGTRGHGSGTSAATAGFTSTASDGVWVSCVVSGSASNPATVTAGTNYTVPTGGSETNGAANLVGGIEYRLNPGTTTGTGSFTVSSADWDIVAQVYKAAASDTNWSAPVYQIGAGSAGMVSSGMTPPDRNK